MNTEKYIRLDVHQATISVAVVAVRHAKGKLALIQTLHRFRTKRQLWADSGLALETRTREEHRYVGGQLQRSKKQISIRGLNKDHNHPWVTKSATRTTPVGEHYRDLSANCAR